MKILRGITLFVVAVAAVITGCMATIGIVIKLVERANNKNEIEAAKLADEMVELDTIKLRLDGIEHEVATKFITYNNRSISMLSFSWVEDSIAQAWTVQVADIAEARAIVKSYT